MPAEPRSAPGRPWPRGQHESRACGWPRRPDAPEGLLPPDDRNAMSVDLPTSRRQRTGPFANVAEQRITTTSIRSASFCGRDRVPPPPPNRSSQTGSTSAHARSPRAARSPPTPGTGRQRYPPLLFALRGFPQTVSANVDKQRITTPSLPSRQFRPHTYALGNDLGMVHSCSGSLRYRPGRSTI
jgi:hypothetical protein